MDNATEKESLKDEMRNVVEEARMVIPGIQALFGFQTVAVFNDRYQELPASGTWSHVLGLGLLALSIGLLMAPAAYHRLAERGQVSRQMIDLASRLITFGMLPLMLAFALDVYVVLIAALHDARLSVTGAVATLCVLGVLWFVYPLGKRRARS